MRELRVLHVIGGGDSGGAMTHLLPLVSALCETGCDARLLCLGEGTLADEASRRGSAVAVLPMAHAWDAGIVGPLRRVVSGGPSDFELIGRENAEATGKASRLERRARPRQVEFHARSRWDVIHTHGMRANLPVRLVVKKGRRGPCLFTTVHSDLRRDYASPRLARIYQALDRATLPTVDTVVCVSDALRTHLAERGYPTDRLITIRSGLESLQTLQGRTFDLTASSVSGLRERKNRIGTIARLVPVKDIDLLLDVALLLRGTHPGLEVVVVGDGPEAPALERRSRALGLSETVRFLGRKEDVAAELAGWDAYLVTSAFEGGVSMAVLEAMAAAVPVVTTAAGGVEEAVVDGETGFVVSRNQPRGAISAALAGRAAHLLDDSELRARMGAAAARRVRESFAIERTASATRRAYERCLAAKGALL